MLFYFSSSIFDTMFDTKAIFNINSEQAFEQLALDLFKYQFENNKVYRSFCDLLYKHPSAIDRVEDIPFLPIQFFKSHKVLNIKASIKEAFTSSGTTGSRTSKHYITDPEIYRTSFRMGFEYNYGHIDNYAVLALLPSYLERQGSSLIYMVEDMIKQSGHESSGFYMDDLEGLNTTLTSLDQSGQSILLIGVSFALLDLVETYQFELNNTIVMETGGMKGRRKEMVRRELHSRLKKGFGVNSIHSEYGMTELLSQAYSYGDGIFYGPSWMKVLSRDPEDPLSLQQKGQTGGLNIIDLANVHSCAFIATQDLGRVYEDGSFEVIGRFDHSDIRGCNLMAV
jgi:phenylacetate-coenzyme A ligase PaaK-like adenylate-forming protein